jgi:hypothetical protein
MPKGKLLLACLVKFSVADPDPVPFSTPGSGMSKKSGIGSGSGIRDEQPRSYFLDLRSHFLG